MRRLPYVVLTAAITVSSTGFAQEDDSNCPDGAWVCDGPESSQADGQQKTGPGADLPAEPSNPRDKRGRRDRGAVRNRSRGDTPPQIYPGREAPPIYRRPEAPPPRYRASVPPGPPPPPRPRHRWRMWGVNMHLLGIGMDSGAADGAHMGGLGGVLRYRPVRHFAFDLGLDFVGGTDYQGAGRWELPVSASALMYVNPHSASQLYFLAGLDWSSAGVRTAVGRDMNDEVKHYVYFGGHIGIGMEFRVTRLVSINADLLGFMRNRVDSNASRDPEFIDAETGAVTNTSGGAMLRGGATLYF